jgi:alginate O-acetyltransferase complex protein AlgI
MLFQTPLYPIFLVASALIYWAAPMARRRDILTATSLGLLTYLSWRGTALFVLVTIYVYVLSARLRSGTQSPRARTLTLAAALAVPIGYLAAFKYFPDYAPPLRRMLESITSGELILPLGISFFTFKFIHYIIESRRRSLPPHGFADFLAFVSLFSTFPAGPIERFGHIAPQLRAPRLDTSLISGGLERILVGMFKKIVIADLVLVVALDRIGNPQLAPNAASALTLFAWLWGRMLLVYFDFSGYSDIAIGTSRLFGLDVMENFRWPLLRRNISEFWRNWHISLSSWCRDYVYFPVFGLTRRPKLAIFASMLVLGYWHGANPKWICWGIWHAGGLALWQVWQQRKRTWPRLRTIERSAGYQVAAWLVTVNFVALGAVWIATDTPVHALSFLYYMFIG